VTIVPSQKGAYSFEYRKQRKGRYYYMCTGRVLGQLNFHRRKIRSPFISISIYQFPVKSGSFLASHHPPMSFHSYKASRIEKDIEVGNIGTQRCKRGVHSAKPFKHPQLINKGCRCESS
jgi:hypothetical protein